MGVIQVPGRLSGKTYSVKIKGDTPSETEQARIRAYLDEQESTFAAEYEAALGKPLVGPDDGTALGRGFERGKASAKSLLGTTVETIGQQVGLPSIAEYGRGMEEAAAQRQFELSLLQPAPTTRQDVAEAEGFFPTIGAGLTYAGELAGEQIPQLGVGLAGGAAGAVAGGVTAGPAGAIAGFGIGSGLVEAPMLFGANVQRQEEEVAAGRKAAVDLTDALGSTVGQSALTAVTNALAGAGIFVRPGAKLFTRAVSGATVGGTTESLNEVGQQMLERYQAGLPVDSPDAIQEYIDAGVAGGVLGFGAGGIGGAVGGPRPAEAPKATAPAAPAAAPTVTQPSATPGEIAAAAQEVTAGPPQVEVPAVSEEEVTERTLDARGIYDERVAIALDNGASDEEAAQTAARATLNYISELPQPVQDQLAPFKATMERRARASAGGVMQPDLPDTAYASEFGGTAQRGLFETAKPAAVEAPAAPPAVETEAEIFDRAEAQYAGARKPAPVTRTAAPVSEAQAPAMKPGPAVWANADFDLPVEVADAAPQAGPDGRFYQQVVDPRTKQPSFVPLDELRQAEPAPAKTQAAPKPSIPVLYRGVSRKDLSEDEKVSPREGYNLFATPNPDVAASYSGAEGEVVPVEVDASEVLEFPVETRRNPLTGTEYRNFDKFEFDKRAARLKPGQVLVARNVQDMGPRLDTSVYAEGTEQRKNATSLTDVYAVGRGTPVKKATQGTADVTTVAEAKPEEVGAGVPSGGQGVEGGGRPADYVAGTAGAETPTGGGLGGGVPLSVDTAAAAGEQPTPLTTLNLPADPDKPSLPDTRGKGVRFHGSTSEITQVEDGYVGSDRNFYGQGFYTSDAVAITDGYSKAKGAKDGAVYRVDEIGPVNALDMEQPIPAWLISDYEAGRSQASLDGVYDLVLDAAEEMQSPNYSTDRAFNMREFYDLIRDISAREGIPTYEVQEYFDALSNIIVQRGFNALDHTGGLRTKKTPHSVRIYLAPQSTVRITKVDPKNPDMTPSVEMPKATEAVPVAGEQPTSLSQLEEQLAAARAEAAALRKKVPAGVLKRELVGGAVDPALEKAVSNLQNVLTQRETAAETAKNAVPKKPTHPTRPKKLKAYEDALAKVTDTRDQLAAAQDALSTAELAASLRRGAQPKVQATGKAAAAYTDYINALRRADVIRQQVDSVRAREERTKAELDRAAEAAAVPAAPPSLTRPVVPLYRMGPAIAPTPPLRKTSADAEVDKALADRYATSTPLDIKIGAQLLNEAGMKLGVKDPLTVDDKRLVLTLLNPASRIVTEQGAAAKLYFSRVVRPIDAILMIVDDLTAPYGKYRTEPGTDRATRAYFAGTGRTAAKLALEFVRARMSPAVQNEVDFRISLSAQQNKNQKTWLSDVDRVERARIERLRTKEARFEAAKESDYIREDMSTDPLAALDRELHYSVKMALNAGNLKDALLALSETTNNADLSKLAARFAELTGTTRVKVLYPGDPAKNIGRSRGIFWQARAGEDPERQNIIYLNGQVGMNAHVLMHEMAHAVTANMRYLQPNHPVLKQLEALRKEIIKQSGRSADRDAFYGLTDLGEFIAEAFGRVALGENDNGLRDLMNRTSIYTEVGYQRELPLTATQRLKELFGNFLRSLIGLPSKPYPRKTEYDTKTVKENAMDQFQRLADGILSEAPHVLPDSVFQRAVSEPMVARNVLNNAIQSGPKWDKAGRDKLSDQMQASIPMPLRRMLLGLLQLDWFNDLAGKYFPQIAALKELDDLRRGELVQMEQRAKGVLEDLLAYANKYPEMYTKLMAIMGRATLEEVDPTKPLSNYIMDDDKARVWDELNNELRTADSTGEMRKLFKTVRNMFAQFREDIKAVLSERVKEMTDDVATQNQLVARLLQKLDEEKAIDPYFTLMRKGDFWLTYVADDTTAPAVVDPNTGVSRRPPTQFVQAFNSVWERDQFRTKLEATKDAAGNPVAWDFEDKPRPVGYNPDERVPTAFAQGAINIISSLVSGKTDPEERARGDAAIAEVMDMFSRFTPEHSILQSFNKRKGVRGFMGDITPLGVIDRPTDMVQALAEKSSSLAYQLANMKYGARIQKLKNQSDTTLKTLSNSPSLSAAEKQAVLAYHEEFKARATFAQSPRVSQPAQALRGITFGMTLGFNIAGALNNLMQIPMIGTTELGGRYSMPGAIRELGSAARLLMNAGKTKKVRSFGPDGMELREMSSVDDFGSVANYFEVNDAGEYVLRTDKKIPSKLRNKLANLDVLVEALSANGMLTNSMAQEMLDAEAGWLHKINKWSGFMMHHAERFNRQAMAIAAYNLELGKIDGPASREAKLAAANKAIEIAERVNGSIGASTAPRFAQGAVGSVVFMFKRFGLHMARYIIGTANQALRGASKEDRAIARYQIIGMLGTTALFAGVQGLPFFGELMAVFNLLFTDDDEEPAEVVIEKFLQEPFYHGALNYLTGAEIASRISMSGLIFRENKIEKDQSSLYDLFEMFGGPAVGVYMNTERGVELLSQGELYRGVEAMMPAFIKGAMKSVRFGTEGATTLRTDEVIPVSNLDIALQAIGYTPGAYARQQERVSGEKRIDEAVRSNKRKLLRKYNLALKEGDFAEVREVLKSMREFNQEYPEAAITSDTITRSSNSFIQRSQEMISGVSFSPSGRARAQQSISEYDQDTSFWGSE